MPSSRTGSPARTAFGIAALHSLLALFAPPEARGQASYREDPLFAIAQRVLPAEGPGSAHFNPAALSETRLVFIQGGAFQSRASLWPALLTLVEERQQFYQLAATLPPDALPFLPIALSAGFSSTQDDSRIDGTTAILRESLLQPGVAISFPAERGADNTVALGIDFPIHHFSAFGVAENWSTGMNLGILGTVSPGGHRIRAGFAWHHLMRPEVRLPDNRGGYSLMRRAFLSLAWSSPAERIRIHGEAFLRGDRGDGRETYYDDRMGISGWEIEYRPIPWMGAKLEKAWRGDLSSFGLVFLPRFGKVGTRLEANFSHYSWVAPPAFPFGDSSDEGYGFVQGMTLSLDI